MEWSWRDKSVCPSSDRINCIIRPKRVLNSVFVGFRLTAWLEFERQISHWQKMQEAPDGSYGLACFNDKASLAGLIDMRGFTPSTCSFPVRRATRPATVRHRDGRWVEAEKPRTAGFAPFNDPLPPSRAISASHWCLSTSGTTPTSITRASTASTARVGWMGSRATRLASLLSSCESQPSVALRRANSLTLS